MALSVKDAGFHLVLNEHTCFTRRILINLAESVLKIVAKVFFYLF